jgi:hypothetical protein
MACSASSTALAIVKSGSRVAPLSLAMAFFGVHR